MHVDKGIRLKLLRYTMEKKYLELQAVQLTVHLSWS